MKGARLWRRGRCGAAVGALALNQGVAVRVCLAATSLCGPPTVSDAYALRERMVRGARQTCRTHR